MGSIEPVAAGGKIHDDDESEFGRAMLFNAIPVFAAAAGNPVGLVESWIGLLSFTLQLYYDFSGYSDMAIGLASMIGVRFPLNFNSPYKATSLIDFWRRWHRTWALMAGVLFGAAASLVVGHRPSEFLYFQF
jgi:hypothetical protein